MPASPRKIFSACRIRKKRSPAISPDLLDKSIMDKKSADETSAASGVQGRSEKCRCGRSMGRNRAGHQDAADHLSELDLPGASARILRPRSRSMRGFWCVQPRRSRNPIQNACANSVIPACPLSSSSCFRPNRSTRLSKPLCSLIPSAKCRMHSAKTIPTCRKSCRGRSPADAAKDLIANTKLDDVAVRKQLYEGGKAAIDASTDPLIVAMRAIDPSARTARKEFEDKVDSVVRRDGTIIAKARFAQSGFTQPPDATFTLRLSYGAVKGYQENGKAIPFDTNIGGAYEHAAEHGDKSPYNLPESWMKAKAKLDLKTPLNFVSTADIIGGNSGSPTVNKKGEVVGIIFDGNIESLPWNFAYSDVQGRAVSVDSRGIQEALRKIYGATPLADELAGRKPQAQGNKIARLSFRIHGPHWSGPFFGRKLYPRLSPGANDRVLL